MPFNVRVLMLAALNFGVGVALVASPVGFSVFVNDMFEPSDVGPTLLVGVGLGVLEAQWSGRAAAWGAVPAPVGVVAAGFHAFVVAPSVVVVSMGALMGITLARWAGGSHRRERRD